MTTPPVDEAVRKSQHDELQLKLGDLSSQLAGIQENHRDSKVRAGAALIRSYMDSKAAEARKAYKAGGNPTAADHAGLIDSGLNIVAAAGAHNAAFRPTAQPPTGGNTGTAAAS